MKKNLYTVEMPNLKKKLVLQLWKKIAFMLRIVSHLKRSPLINLKEEVFSGVISHGHLKLPASFKWAN